MGATDQVVGTIEDFVATRRLLGEETGALTWIGASGHQNLTFDGVEIPRPTDDISHLSWTASTITLDGVTISA